MKAVICDASPLIFLSKIGQLDLIHQVLRGEIIVLKCVRDEVCSRSASALAELRLDRFFQTVQVVDFIDASFPSASLSATDRSTLNWAIENHPDWLVADERLLRRIAQEKGISVIGVFGILLGAARKGIRPRREVNSMVTQLVCTHGCRISVPLYNRILEELLSI